MHACIYTHIHAYTCIHAYCSRGRESATNKSDNKTEDRNDTLVMNSIQEASVPKQQQNVAKLECESIRNGSLNPLAENDVWWILFLLYVLYKCTQTDIHTQDSEPTQNGSLNRLKENYVWKISYTYIYTYIYIYIYMRIYLYMRAHTNMHTCMHTGVYSGPCIQIFWILESLVPCICWNVLHAYVHDDHIRLRMWNVNLCIEIQVSRHDWECACSLVSKYKCADTTQNVNIIIISKYKCSDKA